MLDEYQRIMSDEIKKTCEDDGDDEDDIFVGFWMDLWRKKKIGHW